jgi:hypothetical protein
VNKLGRSSFIHNLKKKIIIKSVHFLRAVMTIQRVVGMRCLRIRAQVALVLRQWEVAEENWIKTHELAASQKPAKRPLRGRMGSGSNSSFQESMASSSKVGSSFAGSKRSSRATAADK